MPQAKFSMQDRTEAFFEQWSEFVVRHCWVVLAIVLAITAMILPQIRHATMDLSIESYLSKNDPSVADYDAFREQFGFGSFGLITIDTPEDLFTLENLSRLRALHNDLEENVPYLADITSLVNVRRTIGRDDMLIVEELSDIWPQTEADLPAFKQLVLINPAYVGNLVSPNGRLGGILLEPNSYTSSNENPADNGVTSFEELDSDVDTPLTKEDYLTPDEEAAFVQVLIEVLDRHSVEGFKLYASGVPVVNYSMGRDMTDAMSRNMLIGLLLVAALLYLLFRRFSGVWMPLLAVSLSVAMTIALMPLFGFALNGNTQILPTFLLAVGIADAVHIQSVFYKFYDQGMEKKEAIIAAMKNTAVAVVMTSLTTAASLLSFIAADLIPTRALGLFGAIGVVLALYYTIALIPALLAILPVRRRAGNEDSSGSKNSLLALIDKTIFMLGDFGVRHAKAVVIFTLLLCVVAALGVAQIKFSHDPLRWYPEDNPIRVAADLVDNEMSGAQTMQIVFDTHQENGLYEPEVLQLLDDAKQHIEQRKINTTYAKEAISLLSVVKETHKALNNGEQAYYAIPKTREIVAQELFLFENSGAEDLEDFTDSTFQIARFSLRMPWTNAIGYEEYIDTLEYELEQIIEKSGQEHVSVKMTGVIVIFAKTLKAMLTTTIKSYALAFLMVGVLMLMLMGSVRKGVLAFIPNVTPVLFTLGMMGWFNIPLNMLTSTLGCIIIGIAVDDTIHFMHHYRKYAASEASSRLAVHKTLDVVGRALVFTSIVLVGGFIVHIFGEFVTSRHFGLLLSASISLALMANLVLAPALMTLFWPAKSSLQELPDSSSHNSK